MKTRYMALFLTIFLLFFFWQHLQLPAMKPLSRAKLVYRDAKYTVYRQANQVIIKKGFQKTTVQVSENTFLKAAVIKNKTPEQPPMKDVDIKEGLLLAGKENSYLIRLEPEIKLITGYPNPGTDQPKIIILKDSNLLFFYSQGQLIKKYRVATGKKEYYTPEGTFKIVNKLSFPAGQDSLYGTRWMGLAVPDDKDKRADHDARAPVGHKYGIHGTNEPASIGRDASGGCIRLNNRDAEELYSMVPLGTQVEIRNKS
ncbi:L,D-transpeptidase [Desulforamulus hydrothermalis]|uniref:ErfK/YbiS/YcfS/YnhG family protein n=1 Tax=Desulforamulus hydrothermalis Lam5 = DSM 18033 TaxID=1121428 RepID=K8DXL8_9FIRM|nr:L,D-transpeptidase [Desulforamulus hydrothermalis]CCO07412.1 ErfK/YbiS/YcfS/YnhG family protein [Desulforamulus hydrothermalis Lam5 = DSM 18033]SHH36322.1 Lipoprotein-anchoring transpeptidase ErfK/SrfK [Desulforamulus hydrothermalis Lam5 = DSM 18033]